VTDTAPPLAALQPVKLHWDSTTLLPLADTAPPLEVGLEQASKVSPTMATVELMIANAAPEVAPHLPPQSKTVALGTPEMTSDDTLLMLTVVSL
jgi:hypothetical protein